MKVRICPICGRYNLADNWNCANESCGEVLLIDTITDVSEPLPPNIDSLLQDDKVKSRNRQIKRPIKVLSAGTNKENGEISREHSTATVYLKPIRIGGWLFLPAIGLVLGCIGTIPGLIYYVTTSAKVEQAGYGVYYGVSVLAHIFMSIYTIMAAHQFFDKMKSTPSTMIRLLVAGMSASLLKIIAAFGSNADPFKHVEIFSLISSVISAAIWIQYFKISNRVANTFTN